MRVYLAGFKTIEKVYKKPTYDIFLLSSFWEHKEGKYGEYILQDKHILDSGAYTVINNKSGKYNSFDWDSYLKKYINFIKKTRQKLFFELDIDCIIGLKKVEYYRKVMEDAIGISPIVCWHINRGKDYFIKCCENYPYVALGTTTATAVGRRIRRNPYILNWFISHAHKNNAKIHGLGFTSTPWLKRLKFDSVDSTSWLSGGKYGRVHIFNRDGCIVSKEKSMMSSRIYDYNKINIFNFEQWVKFQKYADINL